MSWLNEENMEYLGTDPIEDARRDYYEKNVDKIDYTSYDNKKQIKKQNVF